MYIYNIAIRWANGDLEGFGASALTEHTARDRAIRKAVQKSLDMGITGSFIHLNGEQYRALTIEEQDELQRDWDNQSL